MSRSQRSRRGYEIVIRGGLSPRLPGAFDHVALQAHNGVTTLRAEPVDQSGLYGMLQRLGDFGIELISVRPRRVRLRLRRGRRRIL